MPVDEVRGVSTDSVDQSIEKQQNSPPCLNPLCIGCGPENRHGLRLSFSATEDGVSAPWTPDEHWQSYPDTVHGGIVTTVLDEAMSKAVIAMGWRAFTVDLRVRFHSMVRPGHLYVVNARVVEKRKRKITAEASITSRGGMEHARGWATFLERPDTKAP